MEYKRRGVKLSSPQGLHNVLARIIAEAPPAETRIQLDYRRAYQYLTACVGFDLPPTPFQRLLPAQKPVAYTGGAAWGARGGARVYRARECVGRPY